MKVLTVGGAMLDTIAIIESDRIERMSMSNANMSFLLLEEGQKTEAQEISIHCGGGAVNAAVAMARLGFDVSVLAKLGQDARAQTILNRLEAEGVSTRFTSRDARAPTGASVLVSSHEHNAAVFTFRGANTLLEPADLHRDAFTMDVVYIAHLSNESADRFPEIVTRAKAEGALVVANPGVRQLSARAGAFQESMGAIDIVTLNRSEAGALVPSLIAKFGEGGPALPLEPGEEAPALAARGLRGGGFHMSLVAFVRALTGAGPRLLLITDGKNGAYVATRDEIMFCPALLTNVAGTAGAGDAFAATFTVYEALGRSHTECLRAASVNAAAVVEYVDTQTGLLKHDALEARLAAVGDELPVRRWKLEGG
jgi:ribokinase